MYVHERKNTKQMSWLQTRFEILKFESRQKKMRVDVKKKKRELSKGNRWQFEQLEAGWSDVIMQKAREMSHACRSVSTISSSWTYILQISTHVFYCIRRILQVSTYVFFF